MRGQMSGRRGRRKRYILPEKNEESYRREA